MWVFFGSFLLFSNSYRLDLHNETRLVLHYEIYDEADSTEKSDLP
jgi:hypothetical protein